MTASKIQIISQRPVCLNMANGLENRVPNRGVAPSIARRCLFGVPDREELRQTYSRAMESEQQRILRRYEFDEATRQALMLPMLRGVRMAGQQCNPIAQQQQPPVVAEERGVKRAANDELPCEQMNKKRQTKITDFMRTKKLRSDAISGSSEKQKTAGTISATKMQVDPISTTTDGAINQ